MAIASANEVDYQLLPARDLGYLNPDAHAVRLRHVQEVRRRCARLRESVLGEE